jgi:transcriptional regulator with XRE-family HTH domain
VLFATRHLNTRYIEMSRKSPSAVDVAVGHNVCIRRMSKGLSLMQLAKRLGVSFKQVQKYEEGVNRIASGRLARIAKILGVPVAALFEGVDGATRSRAPSSGLIANPWSFRLAKAFSEISDAAVRRSIVECVERAAAVRPRQRGRRK